jgi:hypothetical protein
MLFPPTWSAVEVPEEITADQIHVWAWLLDSSSGFGDHDKLQIGLLDANELERFHRFRFECDRARFAITHMNVRRILGAYLGREPERLLFRANRFGKPELVTEAQTPPLYFNLSHSRNIALLALSMDTELGIDIEYLRPIEPEVAESNFSRTELAALSSLEGEAWLKGFYQRGDPQSRRGRIDYPAGLLRCVLNSRFAGETPRVTTAGGFSASLDTTQFNYSFGDGRGTGGRESAS